MISYNDIIHIFFLFQYSTKKCFGLICVLNIYLIYAYTQWRLRGFIAITFVCPFVCAIVSGPVFYHVENGISYITKRLPMTRGCVIILTKVIWASSKSLALHMIYHFTTKDCHISLSWIVFPSKTPFKFRIPGPWQNIRYFIFFIIERTRT